MLTKASVINNMASQGGKSVTISTPARDGEKKEGNSGNSVAIQIAGKDSKQPSTPAHAKEAYKALGGGIGDAIVDVKVSANEAQEQVLSRNGYCQVLQEIAFQTNVRKSGSGNLTTATTFSNKTSIWIWRRSQGTCSGRLKPIIDIILYSTGVSSDLVLAGYTCDPVPIAGQYIWIKRAASEEEERDAIIDLYVTTGRMKEATDPVWQSPGVGWIRIDGNFTKSMFGSIDSFVWYRPARSRSMDMQMTNPVKGAVALTDEIRQTKLIASVRLALRNYVPTDDVKRLANLELESNDVAVHSEMLRSERMVDFSSVYHKYDARGKMNSSKWSKLLHDVGLNMKPNDITQCFNFFDSKHNGIISIEEFTHVLSLTDYEIDLAVEKIRLKLLMPCIPKDLQKQFSQSSKNSPSAGIGSRTDIGVIGAQSIVQHPYIGKNKIRENLTLSHIFNILNVKADSILSIDEIMDLASKVEVFLTEEEARKVYAQMDIDGDDRIEEADFIAFMRKESTTVAKKAFRVRECGALLRRWLVRGTSEKVDSSAAATASNQQWKEFKDRYEKSTGQKFPGFLSARDLQLTIANLGVRLSATESRELALIVAPEKSGRVHLAELHGFMGRHCRSFGELVALIRRELLKDFIESYCAYRQAVKTTGKDDPDLWNDYKKKLDAIRRTVEGVFSKPNKDKRDEEASAVDNDASHVDDEDDDESEHRRSQPLIQQAMMNQQNDPQSRMRKSSLEVISIAQLKLGLQDIFSSKKIPDNLLPNNEEWACLAILVDAAVAEGEVYGVRLKLFLEGLCNYIYSTDMEAHFKLSEKVQLELVSRELKLQIYREAKAMSAAKRLKEPDYQSVFNLFDANRSGTIVVEEFKKQLKKLQLFAISDSQMQKLLGLIDKGKQGSIRFEDFRAFAQEAISEGLDDGDAGEGEKENHKSKADSGSTAKDEGDGDDFDDMTLLLSDNGGAPPFPITRSGDCDWLAWFLYRQAYRVEPKDAENVISELEDRCAECEIANNTKLITAQELWNILGEVGLRGKMTPDQFLAGIAFVCDLGEAAKADGKKESKPSGTDRVDYVAMCRYTVRMGRAFLAQVQEKNREIDKRFPSQLAELKNYFKFLCEESLKENGDKPKYEKIFRRLDTDNDGLLTPKEFRSGLKQLQYKDLPLWNLRMVRRLFDECSKNKDGLMSIEEFVMFILDRNSPDLKKPVLETKDLASAPEGKLNKLNLSDDEEDELFRKRHALTDFELIRKVNDVLSDIVPRESSNLDPGNHLEVVRSSVRRFFQRADPEFKGVVSEERFRAFLRRSGLQDSLTASELRRLTDKLKQRGSGKDRHETVIDYEKLCQQMVVAAENIPKSKAETIFAKFQDAAIQSNGAGRPFLSLCSLIDLRLTGKISKEELIHIGKMMDIEMSLVDLEAMLEMIPSVIVGKASINAGAKIIDYRVLNNALQNFTPRDLDSRMPNYSMTTTMSTTGLLAHALPAYATPGVTHIPSNSVDPMMFSKSINTPLGIAINSPMRRFDQAAGFGSPLPGGPASSSSSAYEKIAKTLIDRVRLAIDERSRSWNINFSLRKKLDTLDTSDSGLISMRSLQVALEEIGIVLTTSEFHAVMSLYGRPDDDRIFYDSFCRTIDNQSNIRDRDREPSRESKDNAPSKSSGKEPYLTSRVMQRLKELKNDGRNPLSIFEVHDLDHTGLVTVNKFKEVVTKLQLLQTEHQLVRAMENFSAIGNSSYINYEEFCFALDKAFRAKGSGDDTELRLSMTNTRRSANNYVMDGDGFDGFRSSRSNINDDFPSGRDDPREYYDSLHRTANQMSQRNVPIELDSGSDGNYYDYALSPPKPSESVALSRSRALSPTRIARSSFDTFANTSSSINRPRTSPSKVGARMWGSDTPLAQKGHPLRGDEDKWCCAVCLYVENPASSDVCIVCDSPNYNNRKDYQIKEQCRNCTFLNGQFAEECEMCGEPLSHHNIAKKGIMSTPKANNTNRSRRDIYY